jgi:c-di-GMP-binding flagellar brake protein YcgR
MSLSPEKRRHPRVQDRLTLRSIAPEHGAAEMSTTDLSLGGVHVLSRRFLPLMTRVEVTLYLPPEGGEDARPLPVKAEAVVVRVDPPQPQETITYRMALFFSRMEQRDRTALTRYLSGLSRRS